MRPSKSRSRSKSNRSRSVGNIVNRVFDSSGPESKVRGTPQQIIEKYNQLARDAHLANDRVAAENFQQHAEHYARLLGEAQREMDARREQSEMQNRERSREGGEPQSQSQPQGDEAQPDREPRESRGGNGPVEVIDLSGDESESTLVETPEEAPAPRPRRPRKQRPPEGAEASQGERGDPGRPEAPAAE